MALDNIESIYPLSPMQESMLFYAQSRISAKHTGLKGTHLTQDVLFNQSNILINGAINVEAYKQAWQQVLDESSALRTGFLWEGLQQAQQFVRKRIELPFEFLNLSELDKQAQQRAIEQKQKEDIERGFDLNVAPLMRISLFQLSDKQYRLMWSSHHLIIDRWCIAIVFEKVNAYYDALSLNKHIAVKKAPPYKAYIAWRHKKDKQKSEQYWRKALRNFSQPSLLCDHESDAGAQTIEHQIDSALLNQIKAYCRENKLTIASFFQSAWALALNRVLGLQDIVFGQVVSGRPSEIKDVENIIGSFVNNIPVRISLPEKANVKTWIKDIQSQSYQRFEHEHESPLSLHEFTSLSSDEVLFDHILVWQNSTTVQTSQHLQYTPLDGQLRTAYPLTLSIQENDQTLQLSAFTQNAWSSSRVVDLFSGLNEVFASLISASEQESLADIASFKLDESYQQTLASADASMSQVAKLNIQSKPQALLNKVVTGRTRLSQTVMEEFLTREWKSILELDEVGLDEDFFALGGTSLKAAQLVSRVEQAEQKHLPIIRLFEGRTIRDMAKVYLSTDWSIKPTWITPVNKNAKGKPIFFIASPEVNTLGYAQLVRELGDDIPAYIVQPPPQSEHIRQVRTSDMPALSLEFIREIQKVQASGPYQIVGMCSGAHLSGEIVRQLEKQSIEVDVFVVINTWSLYTISALYHCEKLVDFYRMLRYYVRRVKSLKFQEVRNRFIPAIKRRFLKSNEQDDVSKLTSLENDESGGNHENVPAAPIRQYDETVVPVKEEKWAKERPKDQVKIKAKVTVFRIEHKPYWRIQAPALGWEYLANEVEVIDLKETVHVNILRDPHIGHFAQQLRQVINT